MGHANQRTNPLGRPNKHNNNRFRGNRRARRRPNPRRANFFSCNSSILILYLQQRRFNRRKRNPKPKFSSKPNKAHPHPFINERRNRLLGLLLVLPLFLLGDPRLLTAARGPGRRGNNAKRVPIESSSSSKRFFRRSRVEKSHPPPAQHVLQVARVHHACQAAHEGGGAAEA